ncbi:MAG: winged helix-turn-helix transcriptional regulator [Anaerovibrio sp.]|uniref:AlbA family DNA-binding domain-containing protein n=1 Tax=Anaerovibrio sp. TaxID=1872532 RepID=UPI0025BDBA45|nr:helix-turn-helix domain-containing protein [Anaerovibrio sp.]MBE6099304.1 winged helix-turn-helix transcriptional regulator [Anaerovibrio sp.]
MQIRELIGEATEYDKKQVLEVKRPKSWLKSISAFANSFGGKLIFGIDDGDEIVGLQDAKKDAEIISETIKTRMNPIPKFKLDFEVIDGKELIVVEVMTGDETPYYYSGEGQLIAFVRIGNESVSANPTQLRELVIRGSGQSYDSLPSRYKFEDMAFTKLRSVYKQKTGKSFENTDYESFGIIDNNGKLTNAGALLADESPIGHSRVFCTRWNGLTKASGLMDALDDEEYYGGLVSLFQDALKFIMRNNRKAWRKAATRRIEYPDYPERAITEGLVNALIHRDYLVIGSEVHIDMFDDRLEIYSPGGMVDGSSLEGKDLRNISSKRRNPILADIFSRLKLMERRGSGFKKILEDYDFQENSREDLMPKFVADNKDFLLILYNLNYYEGENVGENSDKVRRSSEKFGEKALNATQKEILMLLKENGSNSALSIAKKLNITSRAVEKNIKVLREQGIIVRHGAARGGYWEVKK